MKKYIPLFIIVFLQINFITLRAQNFYPFPDSNAVWIIGIDDGFGGINYNNYSTSVNKDDTIINAQSYVKIFSGIIPNLGYMGAYRSDTSGMTYYIPADSIQEYVLRDLSKNAGDSIYNVLYDFPPFSPLTLINFYVDSVDYITVGPYLLKRIYLSNKNIDMYYPLIWIEKIGCAGGGFYNNITVMLSGRWLNCMSYNDTIYYMGYNYGSPDTSNFYVFGSCGTTIGLNESDQINPSFNISPNPFSDYITVKDIDGNNPFYIRIFNSLGQLIYQKKNAGFKSEYFVIKLPELNNGLYFCVISDKSKILFKQKLIKE